MEIHVVKRGDTLSAIARQYGVDARWIERNNAVVPGRLVVGQTLVILTPGVTHTVGRGETLSAIARRYGVSLNTLWRNNLWLYGGENVQPGDRVVVAYREQGSRALPVSGYIYPHVRWPVLRQALPYTGVMMPFTYGFSDAGQLVGLGDTPFIALAREYGTAPYMHLSTLGEDDRFSSERAALIFEDMALQQTLIDNILATVEAKGYDGLDVDFEYIEGQYADDYVAFLTRLKAELAPRGLGLITAVAPKERADQKGLLYEGHDYKGIGAVSDQVLVMTYEWGYAYSSPRAVAPIGWVRRVLDYAVTDIPRGKIYMGMPNYGYDWPLPWVEGETRATSISNGQAAVLAARHGAEILYDETAQAPYFHYTDDQGIRHEVWFEDARSMQAKLTLLEEYRLYGAGYWNLMRDFPQNWLVVSGMFSYPQ